MVRFPLLCALPPFQYVFSLGESHPGPKHDDGTYVGRSAPEIDVFEATVGGGKGIVSQSGQWAPFNEHYDWFNTSDNLIIYNSSMTLPNGYRGGVFQQAISSISQTNQNCYEKADSPCYSVYGFEYKPGFDGAVSICRALVFISRIDALF
jgi:beta-glucan synthesis-associated protein KRE6